MSESHGTCLSLKRCEDFAKVAAYVKQQDEEFFSRFNLRWVSENDKDELPR